MGQKLNVLNNVDNKLISKFSDKSIKHSISTKMEFTINIAGTDFHDFDEAIIHAYRCGLATMNSEQSKKAKEGIGSVDQDELYKLLQHGHSVEHKADFLREIAKEWFPIEQHEERKVKTVHLELIELANFLEK